MRLEDLRPKASIHGILPDSLVTVVAADWHGSDALELTYKTADGRIDSELLYRYDEARLSVAEAGRPWSFDGDGALFQLVSEAQRIRLAHLFDPVLAVHTSLIEPSPHQKLVSFTRYAKVLDAAGNAMPVRDALVLINQVLDEILAEQEGDFDSDTRWALAWFEQSGFAEGEFGLAETLSQAKVTSVGGMVQEGILVT